MDLNYVLLWFTAVSGVFGLIRLLRSPSRARSGWIRVFVLLLLILGFCRIFFPHYAGIAGFVFWCTFVLVPGLLYRQVQNDLFRQKFGRARRLAQWARLLHPADGFREYPELLHAFELTQQDNPQEAESILQRYQSHPGWVGDAARLFAMRFHSDWNGIVASCKNLPDVRIARSPDMLTLYLRALGETGQTGEMVEVFGKYRKAIHATQKSLRDLARLYLYAFSGRKETVEGLFRGTLHLYPRDTQEFWIATAELAAGLPEGHRRLESLRSSADGLTRKGIEARIQQELPAATLTLLPPHNSILQEEEAILHQEERYDASARLTQRPVATYALLILNMIVFGVEVFSGGATDLRTLFRLGAVWPTDVVEGDWWRVIAAQFLHYGAVHLAMNMLGLYVLGPFAERHLGRLRYLLLYLISGAASMLTIVLLALSGQMEEHLIVGASGSIFGLVGATGAILLRGWTREGAVTARRRLRPIVMVIVLQAVFDLLTPQVSFIAHLSGAVYGFLLSWFAVPAPAKKATIPSES